jgi:hypothetical protein
VGFEPGSSVHYRERKEIFRFSRFFVLAQFLMQFLGLKEKNDTSQKWLFLCKSIPFQKLHSPNFE